MKKNNIVYTVFLCALVVVIFDQAVKYIVKSNMHVHQSIPVINNIFNITFVTNTGSAFGMFKGFSGPLIFLSIAVIGFILFNLDKIKEKEVSLQILTGFVLGGVIGNLIDRIAYGYVIDFLEIGYQPVYMWPVFNIADSFLTVSVIFLSIYFLKKEN